MRITDGGSRMRVADGGGGAGCVSQDADEGCLQIRKLCAFRQSKKFRMFFIYSFFREILIEGGKWYLGK